jgi:hypothetical protein
MQVGLARGHADMRRSYDVEHNPRTAHRHNDPEEQRMCPFAGRLVWP